MPTPLYPQSKADTVLVTSQSVADLFVDFSQERTNLDENVGDYLKEWPSARTALTEPREILVIVSLRSTSSGTLINHGNMGTIGYRIAVSSSVITCSNNGGTVISATIPGMVSGSDRRVLISWCCRPDAAETVVHELALYNYTTDTWAFARATSSAQTTDTSWNFTLNGNAAGTGGLTAGVDVYQAVRIGRRFHSVAEQSLDWVASVSPPAQTARIRNPMLNLEGLPFMGEGELAGPSYLWCGSNNLSVELRTTSPLVNMVPLVPAEEDSHYAPVRYFRNAPPPDGAFKWCTRYFRRLLISPKHNAARVRVFIQQYYKGEDGPTTIFMRCYSAINLIVGTLKFSRTPTTHINLNHGENGEDSLGEWVDLGILPLTREASGIGVSWWLTNVMLGFYIDPSDDVAEADTFFKIRAWTVEPFRDDDQGGGFDQPDEKKGG